MPITVLDTTLETDDEGYLTDPSAWNDDVARELARQEGIELGEEHWAVLRFMREYYEEHQIIADSRFVIRFLAGERQRGKAARDILFQLFPYGYVKQACKIAGMRRPRGWSTG